MTKQEIKFEAKQRATACIEWIFTHNSKDPNFITNQFIRFADSVTEDMISRKVFEECKETIKTLVDADGNLVTVETLKNACEIVRSTTRQKIIEQIIPVVVDMFDDMVFENEGAYIDRKYCTAELIKLINERL